MVRGDFKWTKCRGLMDERAKLCGIPMIAEASLGWKGKTQDAPRQKLQSEDPGTGLRAERLI